MSCPLPNLWTLCVARGEKKIKASHPLLSFSRDETQFILDSAFCLHCCIVYDLYAILQSGKITTHLEGGTDAKLDTLDWLRMSSKKCVRKIKPRSIYGIWTLWLFFKTPVNWPDCYFITHACTEFKNLCEKGSIRLNLISDIISLGECAKIEEWRGRPVICHAVGMNEVTQGRLWWRGVSQRLIY